MGLAETAELAVRINLSGNASTGIDKLTRKVNGLGGATKRIGKGFGQIGAGLGRAGLLVGGAAVAGLGAAAKAAIDFEDAFAGVKKTVDETKLNDAGLSFESLAKSFRNMATEIPIAATEFARLGETAGALGVAEGSIEDFVRITAQLGVTTNLTSDEAADALGRIGTILKFTGKDYENFADSLVALGNAGASTEAEIAEVVKRFAAEGKAAGLATTQIAGLASVTSSLGFAPERGGTALARVFANLGTNISLANKKGKAFASITGRSIKDLQDSLDKGEGLGIFLDVLKGIKGLSPTEANRTLKALGITNTSDRTIFRAMSENLPEVTKQLGIAADATGALSKEATEKFNTIKSKLIVLKQNFIEAGITIGEGFLPALGRAADKLTAFLKVDSNKSALKAIGEDIGKAIDGIDWGAVLSGAREFVGVMKGALSFALEIVKAVNSLPTQVKAAAAGLLVLDKASGGLLGAGIGNIAGGAAQGLASRLPGVGKLFAQPVFVTNFPLGFGAPGGGGAPIAGGGAAAGAAAILPLAGIGALMVGAAGIVAEPLRKLLGVTDTGLGTVKAEVAGVKIAVGVSQAAQAHANDAIKGQNTKTQEKITTLGVTFGRVGKDTMSATERVKAAALETKRETTRGSQIVAATNRTGSASVVGAIYANRPVITTNVTVNATTVSKTVVVKERYGSSGGSRNQNSSGSGTIGNGGR